MYAVCTKYVFEASHALSDCNGVSEDLHAHAFCVEVEVSSSALDAAGRVVDFHELDRRVGEVMGPLRGRDLSTLPPFEGNGASSEMIARVLHGEVVRALADLPVRVAAVTVWEDECHGACFREET